MRQPQACNHLHLASAAAHLPHNQPGARQRERPQDARLLQPEAVGARSGPPGRLRGNASPDGGACRQAFGGQQSCLLAAWMLACSSAARGNPCHGIKTSLSCRGRSSMGAAQQHRRHAYLSIRVAHRPAAAPAPPTARHRPQSAAGLSRAAAGCHGNAGSRRLLPVYSVPRQPLGAARHGAGHQQGQPGRVERLAWQSVGSRTPKHRVAPALGMCTGQATSCRPVLS